MKTVQLESWKKKGKSVSTPWLTVDEAAVYCSLSRNGFSQHVAGVPCGGSGRYRWYHVKVLDSWMNNELDVEFLREPKKPARKSRMRDPNYDDKELALVDPGTGKVFL